MAVEFDYKHVLTDGQSLPIIPLESRSTGVFYAKIDISGNSILSTLLVENADPGSSVFIQYFDFTTGGEIGEANLLKEHALITSGLTTNRILVGNTHDKAYLKATVIGNIRFSVYGTVVSTTASELTDAIIEEGQLVNYVTDKVIAIGGLDEENGQWKFIRVSDEGVISVSSYTIFNNILHTENTISKNDEEIVIDKTYIATTRLIKCLFEGDGFGIITVFINGNILAKKRNSWNDRSIEIDLGAYKLQAGDILQVKVKNVNYFNNNATFNIFVYEG